MSPQHWSNTYEPFWIRNRVKRYDTWHDHIDGYNITTESKILRRYKYIKWKRTQHDGWIITQCLHQNYNLENNNRNIDWRMTPIFAPGSEKTLKSNDHEQVHGAKVSRNIMRKIIEIKTDGWNHERKMQLSLPVAENSLKW